MTEERHLLIANTHLIALLVIHLEEEGLMIGKDFAARVEATLEIVPEGPGRDYLATFADALRAKSPEAAIRPALRLISGGVDREAEEPAPIMP